MRRLSAGSPARSHGTAAGETSHPGVGLSSEAQAWTCPLPPTRLDSWFSVFSNLLPKHVKRAIRLPSLACCVTQKDLPS